MSVQKQQFVCGYLHSSAKITLSGEKCNRANNMDTFNKHVIDTGTITKATHPVKKENIDT